MAKKRTDLGHEVVRRIKREGIVMADLKFCDLFGMWQHTTIPATRITEDSFTDGFGFDGSSIRGFCVINESDMLIVPDATTAMIDPFIKTKTISFVCNVFDPVTGKRYPRDPRFVAQKSIEYLKSTGIADTCYIGPEAEFFIFDDVRYQTNPNSCSYSVDSIEAAWNTGREEFPNLGHKPGYKGGYFPVSPVDSLHEVRDEMVLQMIACGIEIETHHHEVGTAGQTEIDMKFDSLLTMADKTLLYKYITKNVAKGFNKSVTFMPKPIAGDNGSGMHVHSSLWKSGKPLFAGDKYAGLSQMALHYIGGLIKHSSALCAITNPTTNSYKRLVPGFEAPVNLCYSQRNRSAAVRIPMFSANPKAKRVEFRCPDPMTNPYLAFSAIMMAGLDGIQNKINPGEAVDADVYELSAKERKHIPSAPGSLGEALTALEKDHAFLTKGNVFTADMLETYIEYKRTHEVLPMSMKPHPYEFELYYAG